MTMSIFDFFKADKYHVTIFLENSECEDKRYETNASIMVMTNNKLYEVELESAYLCDDEAPLEHMVTIRRELNEIIDDWNSAEHWRVINVKTTKIE